MTKTQWHDILTAMDGPNREFARIWGGSDAVGVYKIAANKLLGELDAYGPYSQWAMALGKLLVLMDNSPSAAGRFAAMLAEEKRTVALTDILQAISED